MMADESKMEWKVLLKSTCVSQFKFVHHVLKISSVSHKAVDDMSASFFTISQDGKKSNMAAIFLRTASFAI
jgi:hypothetical protein